MKTIVIFSAYIPPHVGGIERYITFLSKRLVKMNYNVVIVTANYKNISSTSKNDGITIYRIPVYKIFSNRYPIIKHNKEMKKIMKELNQYEIEGIIVNTRFHLTSHIGAKYGYKNNIPVFLIEHGSNYVTLDNKIIDFFANRYEDFLTWKIKKKITGFYGVSNACGRWLKKLKIEPSGTWYNSIELEQDFPNRISHKNINFMYAGRLIKQKGVENILKSFSKLEKENDNIHLFIAGDGPELKKYKNTYKSKNIEFLGKINFEELLNYYAKTDIFLYPPLWPEGLPTSILEAGAMRCCVIGTNQGGIKEIINDKENGLIVEETQKSLYEAMDYLINHKNKIKEYANNLRTTVEQKFSWEVTANKILEDMGVKNEK